jgi:hypothetical protein
VDLQGRSDAELAALARSGTVGAFAALLHRHGPAVRAIVTNDPDPTGALLEVFLVAMRGLHELPPDAQVRPWLLRTAWESVEAPAGFRDDQLVPLPDDLVDVVWAELARRWPDARAPRAVPPWLRWVGAAAALIAIGVVVPTLVLTLGRSGAGPAVEELRAYPIDLAPVDLADEDDLADDGFDLPEFTFPEVSEQATSPTPAPAPAPTPTPTPPSAPPDEPVTEPVPDEPIEEPVVPAPDPGPVPDPDPEPPADGPPGDGTPPGRDG